MAPKLKIDKKSLSSVSQLINPESCFKKYSDLRVLYVDSVDESSLLMIEALRRNESCFVWALIVRD